MLEVKFVSSPSRRCLLDAASLCLVRRADSASPGSGRGAWPSVVFPSIELAAGQL